MEKVYVFQLNLTTILEKSVKTVSIFLVRFTKYGLQVGRACSPEADIQRHLADAPAHNMPDPRGIYIAKLGIRNGILLLIPVRKPACLLWRWPT